MHGHKPTHDIPAGVGRRLFAARVESNVLICREHYRLRLRIAAEERFPATRPGQFIQLGCREPDGDYISAAEEVFEAPSPASRPAAVGTCPLPAEPGRGVLTQPELLGPVALLRRPFSLAGRGDDFDEPRPSGSGLPADQDRLLTRAARQTSTWLEIVHRVVGVGTAWLAGLKSGEKVDLIGPLGNAFALPEGKSLGLLVGGGVGLPPMFYLAKALRQANWEAVAFVGAMSRDLLPVAFTSDGIPPSDGRAAQVTVEFAHYGYPAVITTNDGSLGLKGLITAGLENYLACLTAEQVGRAVVFTCGPNPMMHAVARLAARHGIDCQACMEQAMACGMGTCQSCIVKIEDRETPQATTPPPESRPWRYKLTCTDGPVFPAQSIIW